MVTPDDLAVKFQTMFVATHLTSSIGHMHHKVSADYLRKANMMGKPFRDYLCFIDDVQAMVRFCPFFISFRSSLLSGINF